MTSKNIILLKNRNTNHMLKQLPCLFIIIISGLLPNLMKAQSNPGYLGKTQLLEFTTNTSYGAFVEYDFNVKVNFALQYEKIINRKTGISAGIRIDNAKYRPYFDYPIIWDDATKREYSITNYNPDYPDKNYFKYNCTELYIQLKKFIPIKGYIAPYGSYWGFELSAARMALTENKLPFSPNIEITNEPIYAFVPAVIVGKRIIIADQISVNGFASMGTVFFHSAEVYLVTGWPDSPKEFLNYMMLTELALSRLFTVGVSVGYVF